MTSPLAAIATAANKAAAFLLAAFTHSSDIASQLSKLSPAVVAAILATFFDVVKAAQAAQAAAVAGAAANIPATFTLSETTVALIKTVIADVKNDEKLVVDDLKTLGIVK